MIGHEELDRWRVLSCPCRAIQTEAEGIDAVDCVCTTQGEESLDEAKTGCGLDVDAQHC